MKLVMAHENAELVKGMRKPKGSKRAKDAKEKKKKTKQKKTKKKKQNKKKGTQESISRKTNGHDKALGERVNSRPKEA